MIDKISSILLKRMTSQKLIDSSEYDLYQYGLVQLMTYVFLAAIIFIISSLLGCSLAFFYLFFIFVTSRSLLGGIHLKSERLCFVISCIFLVTVLITFKALCRSVLIQGQANLLLAIALIQLLITILQPIIDHPNKRMAQKEIAKYKVISTKLLLGQISLLIIAHLCGFSAIINLSVSYYFFFHINRLIKVIIESG